MWSGIRLPRRTWPGMLLALAAALVAAILLRFDPNAANNILPPCPLLWLTGWYCPGCGSTRALHALLHGQIGQAMAMNPLLVLALPVLGLMALNAAGWRVPDAWTPVWRWLRHPGAWLAVLLGYWLLRNLPWWPLSWLAPG